MDHFYKKKLGEKYYFLRKLETVAALLRMLFKFDKNQTRLFY